jgi:hypothetical protein
MTIVIEISLIRFIIIYCNGVLLDRTPTRGYCLSYLSTKYSYRLRYYALLDFSTLIPFSTRLGVYYNLPFWRVILPPLLSYTIIKDVCGIKLLFNSKLCLSYLNFLRLNNK